MIEIIMMAAAILGVAFIQNISFSMVSRARNRSNMAYHAICSVFSNGLWLITLGLVGTELILNSNYWMAIPYILGTVSGSLFGAKVSMKIEKVIGATT